MNLKKSLRLVFFVAGLTALLSACAQIQGRDAAKASKPQSVGAGVRSINYGGKEVVLMVRDPKNTNNGSGGDSLNPYSMGGNICCFSIPLIWHAGLQVIVKYQFYPDETWHEQLVDVPPYPEGIAGELWLMMHEDGRAEAVVSNFGPTRPEWPGRVKGRPVQSDEYALKLWTKRLEIQKGMLAAMQDGLKYDTHKLTPEELTRLKNAIENTKERIRVMEENKP